VGSCGLREILSYLMMCRNMRWEHFPMWQLFRNRKLAYNWKKIRWMIPFNPVLRASVCGIFRTREGHDTPLFKPVITTPQFSNRIDASVSLTVTPFEIPISALQTSSIDLTEFIKWRISHIKLKTMIFYAVPPYKAQQTLTCVWNNYAALLAMPCGRGIHPP